MLDRNDVIRIVSAHLKRAGFSIQTDDAADIVAERCGARLFIEVTGETTSKKSSRAGEEFDPHQVEVHVTKAIYRALSLTEAKGAADVVGLAFPRNAPHEDCVATVAKTLSSLGIELFWVEPGELVSGMVLDDRVADVRVTDEALELRLRDGRTIFAPLSWFPRLLAATAAQRSNWEQAASGHGVHWPDIDEDLSVAGLLRATKA